jgi:hypothetical protein
MKETVEPKILHVDSRTIFNIPEGYLEYDAKHYWRKT